MGCWFFLSKGSRAILNQMRTNYLSISFVRDKAFMLLQTYILPPHVTKQLNLSNGFTPYQNWLPSTQRLLTRFTLYVTLKNAPV